MCTIACPKCGTASDPVATNWWYCDKCGDRLPRPGPTAAFRGPVASVPVATPVPYAPPTLDKSQKPQRKMKKGDIIGAFLGMIVGMVVRNACDLQFGLLDGMLYNVVSILVGVGVCRGIAHLAASPRINAELKTI